MKGFCTSMDICTFKLFLILIMQGIKEIESLHLVIALMLVVMWLLGEVKKQSVVPRSSAKVKYRAMAHTTCEMMWLKTLLGEHEFSEDGPMPMYCDNHVAIYIPNNPVFHERTKK